MVGNDFVLFANHPKVLRDAINNVQAPDLSLTSFSQYQQALTLLPPPLNWSKTFLNLASLNAWQGLEPAVQTYQSQIIALELQPKGLLAETALLATPSQTSPLTPLSQPVRALQYIPATTGLAISGSDLSRLENSDLSQLWQQSSQILGAGASGNPLKDIQARWGIDLPKDIFNWVQGEYALGLLPDQGKTTPDLIFCSRKVKRR